MRHWGVVDESVDNAGGSCMVYSASLDNVVMSFRWPTLFSEETLIFRERADESGARPNS